MSRHPFFRRQSGVALPVVLMILAVLTVSTAATIQLVGSENRMGIHDEQQTKAYYLARSAVDLVAQETVSQVVQLNAKGIALRDAVNAYNSKVFSTGEDPTDTQVSAIQALQTDYTNTRNLLVSTVLPSTGTTYTHQIAGLQAAAVSVQVRQVSIGNYEISSAVAIASTGATGRAARIVSIPVLANSSGNLVKQVSTTTPEKRTETKTSPATFNDAVYSFGDFIIKNNSTFEENVSPAVPASVRYEGELYEYKNNKENLMSIDDVKKLIGKLNKSSDSLPVEPTSIIPIEDMTTATFMNAKPGLLPASISPSDNGYYPIINNSGTIQVDASTDNVVIKTNQLNLSNNVSFNVKGPFYFYLYVYDNQVATSASDAKAIVVKGSNNLEFSSIDGTPRSFLIIDQPSTDRNPSLNLLDVNNKADFKGYVYAPYSTVDFKNKLTVIGSIVGGKVMIKNGATVLHQPPAGGSYSTDGSGNTVITIIPSSTTITTTNKGTYNYTPFDIPATGEVPASWVRY